MRPLSATLAAVLALVCGTACGGGPGEARDSTTGLAAGGLHFIHDERIAIDAQEIVIGRTTIRATYAVRNTSAAPISRVVSWPLATIDMNAIGDEIVVLPDADPQNHAAGAVAVDGKTVALAFEQRALAFDRDVTALLAAEKLPLNPLAPEVETGLRGLSRERADTFEERGILRREDERRLANWAVHTTAFWRQTFAPGQPLTIGLAFGAVTASGVWSADSLEAYRDAYCIDAELEQAIAARAAKTGRGLVTHRITYSVANEPGWWKPIPNFRLAIEKPELGTLVATCLKGFRTVGPTLIERLVKDWQPDDDIQVLIIN